MIKVVTGSIFDSECQTITNAVNCVGVMGKGIALEFKKRFPAMFSDYKQQCKNKQIEIGKPYLHRMTSPWIMSFPTKFHWRDASKIEYIEEGLDYLVGHVESWNIASLALPALGCGLGGLQWAEVEPIMHKKLEGLSAEIELYSPC